MHDDQLTKIDFNCATIIEFVGQQLGSKGFDAFHTIVNKVRLLSEVVQRFRVQTEDDNKSFSHILRPESIKDLQECIKDMFHYCSDKEITMERPSTVVRLAQTLAEIVHVLKIESLASQLRRLHRSNSWYETHRPPNPLSDS